MYEAGCLFVKLIYNGSDNGVINLVAFVQDEKCRLEDSEKAILHIH